MSRDQAVAHDHRPGLATGVRPHAVGQGEVDPARHLRRHKAVVRHGPEHRRSPARPYPDGRVAPRASKPHCPRARPTASCRAELLGRSAAPAPPAAQAPLVNGMVEVVLRRMFIGWVSVPADAPPTRVDLFVGPVKLASTYATPGVPMTGVSHQAGKERSFAFPRQPGAVPSPRGDRRNSGQQLRTFSFRTKGLWDYVTKETRIAVRVAGQRLPINGHGMWVGTTRRGPQTPAVLKERLGQGWVLSQMGDVQLSKRLDTQWQADVMASTTGCAAARRRVRPRPVRHLRHPAGRGARAAGTSPTTSTSTRRTSPGRTAARGRARAVEIALALVERGLGGRVPWSPASTCRPRQPGEPDRHLPHLRSTPTAA